MQVAASCNGCKVLSRSPSPRDVVGDTRILLGCSSSSISFFLVVVFIKCVVLVQCVERERKKKVQHVFSALTCELSTRDPYSCCSILFVDLKTYQAKWLTLTIHCLATMNSDSSLVAASRAALLAQDVIGLTTAHCPPPLPPPPSRNGQYHICNSHLHQQSSHLQSLDSTSLRAVADTSPNSHLIQNNSGVIVQSAPQLLGLSPKRKFPRFRLIYCIQKIFRA